MSPQAISLILFACLFSGVLLGISLRPVLPEKHLTAESKSTLTLGTGLIGTMASLVLGLLVATAASSFFTQRNELTEMSAKLVLLDRVLAHYGPETKEARETMSRQVAGLLDQMWPQEHSRSSPLAPKVAGEALYDEIQKLSPQNDTQRSIKGEALGLAMAIGSTRWLMFEQQTFPIPKIILGVIVFWFTVVFTSFGLFAPRNATVIVTLLLCALSLAGAILLILDMFRPFEGLIHISSAPLRNALAHMGK